MSNIDAKIKKLKREQALLQTRIITARERGELYTSSEYWRLLSYSHIIGWELEKYDPKAVMIKIKRMK